jgi:hypothetical protein
MNENLFLLMSPPLGRYRRTSKQQQKGCFALKTTQNRLFLKIRDSVDDKLLLTPDTIRAAPKQAATKNIPAKSPDGSKHRKSHAAFPRRRRGRADRAAMVTKRFS